MRKIAVIVGSLSDLSQCQAGLMLLKKSGIEVLGVYVRSQHRNTLDTQNLLGKIYTQVDAAIIGAGWANHLTGCCDAFLRYTFKTPLMPIIGVAFEDPQNDKHTQAAILSITEVPGTQVIYRDEQGEFIGPQGFLRACKFAIFGDLPEMKIPSPKQALDLTLDQAIEKACE